MFSPVNRSGTRLRPDCAVAACGSHWSTQSLPRSLDVRLRRYLIRETPEQTAEELSHSLQAA